MPWLESHISRERRDEVGWDGGEGTEVGREGGGWSGCPRWFKRVNELAIETLDDLSLSAMAGSNEASLQSLSAPGCIVN